MHFTLLNYLNARPLLKCLDCNLLSTLGLKEVHDAGFAFTDLLCVLVVLIVKIDTFSVYLNAKQLLLRLRLVHNLIKDHCIFARKLTQFGRRNDLLHFKARKH